MSERIRKVVHSLKTWPEFFQLTLNGKKKFELRRNDRDYRVGDELLLKEWDPEVYRGRCEIGFSDDEESVQFSYTGREVIVRVNYIMPADQIHAIMGGSHIYEPPDYIIMSVSLIP
ncbi:MAG: DUF3850 domain-containing protein [Candidatus Micrarchaeia archaeon]|jgi:hypothetical protein